MIQTYWSLLPISTAAIIQATVISCLGYCDSFLKCSTPYIFAPQPVYLLSMTRYHHSPIWEPPGASHCPQSKTERRFLGLEVPGLALAFIFLLYMLQQRLPSFCSFQFPWSVESKSMDLQGWSNLRSLFLKVKEIYLAWLKTCEFHLSRLSMSFKKTKQQTALIPTNEHLYRSNLKTVSLFICCT